MYARAIDFNKTATGFKGHFRSRFDDRFTATLEMNFFSCVEHGYFANFLLQATINDGRVVFADLMTTFAMDGEVVVARAIVAADLGEAVIVDAGVMVMTNVADRVVQHIAFEIFLSVQVDFFVVHLVFET